MKTRGYVLISGLPGSGKSRLGRELAQLLGWPMFDKDEFLEAIFETEGAGDAVTRRAQSKRADVAFQHAAAASQSAVLVSWWRHPKSDANSGTPIDWLAALPQPLIEVHCRCAVATAVERFIKRRRHPGHLDGRWTADQLQEMFTAQSVLGQVFPGQAIFVDTDRNVDLSALANRIALASASLQNTEQAKTT
jgi:hypothetical protein